jgi:hypothetical protein
MISRSSAFWALPTVVLAATLGGCEPKLTTEKFAQLKTGMTIDEVFAILGPGEKQTEGQAGAVAAGMMMGLPGGGGKKAESDREFFTWKEDRVEIGITFEKGKLVDKVQRGL